jgi:hypothetical protein
MRIASVMILIVLSGCVSANDAKLVEARDNEIAGIKTTVGVTNSKLGIIQDKLETLVSQSQPVSTVIDRVDQMDQKIQSQVLDKIELLHKDIQAGTINYGGAGWVVLGGAVLVVIFLGSGVITVYLLSRNLSRTKGLLQLVTGAIQASSPDAQHEVKSKVKEKTSNGNAAMRDALTTFLVEHNLFAEAKKSD